MRKIKIWYDNPSTNQLDEVVETLRRGEIAIIPTDSLYAICCDALNPKAIDRICRIKGLNPEKNNLSIICSDISMAAEYSHFDNRDFRLIRDNTPGAFTFLVRSASNLPRAFKNRKTVGIRIPACETARQIAERLGNPLMTTSIEFDEDDYARNPELIAENYEDQVDLMVEGEDGGTQPSTIVDLTGSEPEILRQGAAELEL